MLPKLSIKPNLSSSKKFESPSTTRRYSLTSSSTVPLSARLLTFEIFNSKTTVKQMYQEKEINQRIHRKLELEQIKKRKTSNIKQDGPTSRPPSKSCLTENPQQKKKQFENIPKGLQSIVHCLEQKIRNELEINLKQDSTFKLSNLTPYSNGKIIKNVNKTIIQNGSLEKKNLITIFTDQIVNSIQKLNEEKMNLRHCFWPYLLSKFHRYYLNNTEMRELLNELKSIISVNFERQEH